MGLNHLNISKDDLWDNPIMGYKCSRWYRIKVVSYISVNSQSLHRIISFRVNNYFGLLQLFNLKKLWFLDEIIVNIINMMMC